MLSEQQFQKLILPHLSPQDDADFWLDATATVLHDAEFEIGQSRPRLEVYAQIGACSHWLRPHQTRWTAAGGFAWPVGYGAPGTSGFSRFGLPQFDWSALLRWDFKSRAWQPVEKFHSKRHFLFRAALPTRTKRHAQAAIHTTWLPRRPSDRKQNTVRAYGFRNAGAWECVAGR